MCSFFCWCAFSMNAVNVAEGFGILITFVDSIIVGLFWILFYGCKDKINFWFQQIYMINITYFSLDFPDLTEVPINVTVEHQWFLLSFHAKKSATILFPYLWFCGKITAFSMKKSGISHFLKIFISKWLWHQQLYCFLVKAQAALSSTWRLTCLYKVGLEISFHVRHPSNEVQTPHYLNSKKDGVDT